MHLDTNYFAASRSPATSRTHSTRALLFAALLALLCLVASPYDSARAQSQRSRGAVSSTPTPTPAPQLTRSTTRHETRRFGYGGTFTIYGAPTGSITIEAWPRSEVDVTAEIEHKGATEAELATLAAVNNFVLDEDGAHLTLLTTGTHDRKFMKRAAKDFPKRLLTLPWKIDYRIKVPAVIDLEIYAGRGDFTITNVDGSLRLNAGEGDANLTLAGGDTIATIAGGRVRLRVPASSWRGRGASLRLIRGELSVELPAVFNADIDATVLRSGRIDNNYTALVPRETNPSPERRLRARAGSGGAAFSFEVGDGTIRITQLTSEKP